jgi:hypothetical protein
LAQLTGPERRYATALTTIRDRLIDASVDPGFMAAVLAQREGEAASVERAFDENFQFSGVRKVWRQLLREGHTMLGNIKCAITGPYRAIRKKQTVRYLADFERCFNHRFDLAAMIPPSSAPP